MFVKCVYICHKDGFNREFLTAYNNKSYCCIIATLAGYFILDVGLTRAVFTIKINKWV